MSKNYVIGIDIGGSTTKIVGFKDGEMTSPFFVKATDPIASVYGAFGRFVAENAIELSDIDRVMVTGVGAAFIKDKIYGIPTGVASEFHAVGLGGLYLAEMKKAVVVSMGTGTAFVEATEEGAKHMGGTGMGGGTLLGLSSQMLGIRDFDLIHKTAELGDIDKVDLFIRDITKGSVNQMGGDVTAANFGKVSDVATPADIALGIINLVFQTIGMMAIFCVKERENHNVVLSGTLTKIPQAREIFEGLTVLSGVKFCMPEHAEFATATGAALVYKRGWEYREI